MRYDSKKRWFLGLFSRVRVAALVVLSVALVLGIPACLGRQDIHQTKGSERGILFSHKNHIERGLEDCSICHDPNAEPKTLFISPAHEICSTCHTIPEDRSDTSGCALCHTRPDYSVTPWKPLLNDEVRFSHATHTEKGLQCNECHTAADAPRFPYPAMPVCVQCHEKKATALTECTVCHTQISRETVPQMLYGRRIQHDNKVVWEKIHGREARFQPNACALCHDFQEHCDTCHATKPPQDHTLTWRRKTHGMEAAWNRQRCAACHEEDMCVKCHQHKQPDSHRAGWGSPLNRHCINCHYPPQRTGCVICHEDVDHERAMPSPHMVGIIPPNCGLCHPGGVPFRAPHLQNSSVQCIVCHQ